MESDEKNTPHRDRKRQRRGRCWRSDRVGAITAKRVRGARPSRVRVTDTRATGDGTFETRRTRRVARGAALRGSRARSSLSEIPPPPPWYRAKKKTLSSADARGKRAVGSVRRSNQARARRETTVVGCRSKPPPCARVPSSAPRATARFPATAPRDVGPSDGREPPSGRACQICQWVRTLEAVVRRAARTGARRAGRPTAAMADILEVVVFEVLCVLDGCSNAPRTRAPLQETHPERARRISRDVSTNQSAPCSIPASQVEFRAGTQRFRPANVENSGLNFFAIETVFHDRTRAPETESRAIRNRRKATSRTPGHEHARRATTESSVSFRARADRTRREKEREGGIRSRANDSRRRT